jgi:uncharacterized protein YcbK (DUF882 family)
MGSRVPANPDNNPSSLPRGSNEEVLNQGPLEPSSANCADRRSVPWQTGLCVGLAALIVVLGNRGLQTAEANGDTRTLTLHHLHTDENITITYKRDGRYDEEALKKLDHILRDWRKDESIHMDPRLFDVVWEVSREFGKDKVIQIVCGYRSPATNAMLRRRSSGVAQFSQHTLGKAMDFYIQGASLEEIREAGLRLQRGGVGYYPTSGSPFVHLDVGSVRHWPRMSREQLARVFPNGRTVHVPSDGTPLPGYAQALADLQKRGSVDAPAHGGSKSILTALFGGSEDEDDKSETAAPAPKYSLASISKTEPGVKAAATTPPVPPVRPQRLAMAAVVASTADDGTAGPASTHPWSTPGDVPHAPLTNPDNAPAVAPWPFRDADKDRVPLDMVLAYATEPEQRDNGADFDSRFAAVEREPARTAAGPARSVHPRENGGTAAKKPPAPVVRTASSAAAPSANVPIVKVAVVTAEAGMRYDDPWLRAMILAPRLYGSMTATLHGDPDFRELRTLMNKPTSAVAMSFSNDPYPGLKANSFSGDAVVSVTTVTFSHRTASLQQ